MSITNFKILLMNSAISSLVLFHHHFSTTKVMVQKKNKKSQCLKKKCNNVFYNLTYLWDLARVLLCIIFTQVLRLPTGADSITFPGTQAKGECVKNHTLVSKASSWKQTCHFLKFIRSRKACVWLPFPTCSQRKTTHIVT